MDIDESTKITLVIKSNIFTEISKCVGNRTYSVQLPKTARNQRILEFAHLPAANTNSNIPYRYLQCRYVRNGIEIFSDGYAYIISAKEKIEVCIVWGTPAVLRAIFSDGLKLNEIPDDGKKAPYVRYNEVTQSGEIAYQDGYCYAAIDFLKYEQTRNTNIYDTPEAQARWPKMGYLRPCVLLRYILDRLYTLYGINFVLDYETALWVLHLLLPCVTDNVDAVYPDRTFSVADTTWTVGQKSSTVFPDSLNRDMYRPFARVVPMCDVSLNASYDVSYNLECSEDDLRRLINNGLIGAEMSVDFSDYKGYRPATSIFVWDSNNNQWNPNSGTNITDTWKIQVIGSVLNVDVEAKQMVYLFIKNDDSPQRAFLGGSARFTPTVKSIMYGIDYPLTPNLPDMKVVDFLQWVSAITGTFPRQTDKGNTVLEFVHYHKLFDNKSIAHDWSNKLVRAYDDGAPREIGFTVDGWAQVNHFAYGNSKEVGNFADGEIEINNVQLDAEQDIVGDVFDALQYPNNVPTYKTNADDNVERLLAYLFPSEDETDEPLESESSEPCVMNMQPLEINNVSYVLGVFDDTLHWRNILRSNRYAGLIRSLQKAKILHEVFALTELDIKQFDETIPVYLAQYGYYYAVTEIKSSETGVAEVTLFQLEF
jgi:hypothetical protein